MAMSEKEQDKMFGSGMRLRRIEIGTIPSQTVHTYIDNTNLPRKAREFINLLETKKAFEFDEANRFPIPGDFDYAGVVN